MNYKSKLFFISNGIIYLCIVLMINDQLYKKRIIALYNLHCSRIIIAEHRGISKSITKD